MKITAGLWDSIVLQRDRQDVCRARVSGESKGGSLVLGVPELGWEGRKLGVVRNGKFCVVLRGLPVGGPYTLELSVVSDGKTLDSCSVRDVLVGDVWLCGGQSNMEGWGKIRHAAPAIPEVRAFSMNDRWAEAHDPIHNLLESVDEIHTRLLQSTHPPEYLRGTAQVGVGPAVDFGQAMFRATRVPQGLIACAHGGTTMQQWDPKLKRQGGNSLYGAMLRRFEKNGGLVAGLIWYQGESDARPESRAAYTRSMRGFVKALRRDVDQPALPVVMVQLGRAPCVFDSESWNSIQEQQRLLPGTVKKLAVVPSIDLGLDDSIHLGGAAQRDLGCRIALAMQHLLGIAGNGSPIELRRVRIAPVPGTMLSNVEIEFTQVTGGLVSNGRPSGFEIQSAQGPRWFFDAFVEGRRVILRTPHSKDALAASSLHYGYGTNPYCNIRDKAGRSLPVFGPLPLSDAD